MGEADRLVTQTALAIRDADELEVAASVLDAALRRAKAEGVREVAEMVRTRNKGYDIGWWSMPKKDIVKDLSLDIATDLDARAAQIEWGDA